MEIIELKPGEKLSVMVVDDEKDIREMITEFLEMLDIFNFIIQAEDGSDALRRCQIQRFDLIITDIQMPKLKGIDLIRKIKFDEKRLKVETPTPLIILSANLTGEDVKSAIAMGVKNVVAKPCTADEFLEKVSTVLLKEKKDKVRIKKIEVEE